MAFPSSEEEYLDQWSRQLARLEALGLTEFELSLLEGLFEGWSHHLEGLIPAALHCSLAEMTTAHRAALERCFLRGDIRWMTCDDERAICKGMRLRGEVAAQPPFPPECRWPRPYLDLTESGWKRLREARNIDGGPDRPPEGTSIDDKMCLRRVFGSREQVRELIERHNSEHSEGYVVCVDDGPSVDTPLSAFGWEAQHVLVHEQQWFELGTTRLPSESSDVNSDSDADFHDQVIWTVGMSATDDLAAEDLCTDGTIDLWNTDRMDLPSLGSLFEEGTLESGSESNLRLGPFGIHRLQQLAGSIFRSTSVERPAVDVAVAKHVTDTDVRMLDMVLSYDKRIRHRSEIKPIERWRRRWYERFGSGFSQTFVLGERAASRRIQTLLGRLEKNENGSEELGAV